MQMLIAGQWVDAEGTIPVRDPYDDSIIDGRPERKSRDAAVFTKSVDLAFKMAYGLHCGGVMINDSTDYRLDSMPFGGIRQSGLGREGVRFAVEEMTATKVICLNLR